MLQERIQDRREHFTSHFTGHANDHSNGVPEITPSASPDHTVETQFSKTIQPTLLATPEFTPSTSPDYTAETQSSKIIQPTLLATPEITPSGSPDHTVETQFSKTIQPTLLPTPPEPWLWSPKSNENLAAQACACAAQKSVPQSPIVEAPQTQIPIHLPASTRLRNMINTSEKIIVCPGVYDGLSARIAISVGFDAMYMTGAGTTASRLGMADLGVAQLHDMRTNAEMIANLVPDGPPLIADMDTGYGGPLVIAKAVQQYILAGVAGFHIEDQVLQKRCGHLAGKEVVSAEEYLKRIQAAKGAAQRLRSDIVIIARTDALQSRGYDECVARLRMARDAGADMGILEGCTSKAQYAQAAQDLAGWPLCLNSVENGVSPVITAEEAQAMGYRVMIFSFAGIFPAYTAIKATFEWLKAEGVTGTSSDVTPKTIFRVCGLSESMEIDKEAGGSAFANGV